MGLFGTKRTRRRRDDGSLIVLDRVSKSYETGAPALNGVNLRVKRGEFVFIVGDSGSGKSTLIKLLLRELTPTSGTVLVNGHDVARLRRREIPRYRRNLGIVFQDFRLLKDRNVYENVAFAQRIVQVPGREIRRNVPAILATVGLAGKYKAKPKQLSGGEQQRVALARALINKPPILLADEPTGNLDPKNSWEIMKLLEKIIYLADYIEPTRDFPGVGELRGRCYEDLDAGLLLGLEMTIREMEEREAPIHPKTLEARDALKGQR